VGTHLEGYFVEKSFLPVRIVKRDPLFNGLVDIIYVDEHHYCEVKSFPRLRPPSVYGGIAYSGDEA
jgi:hypothetical protein